MKACPYCAEEIQAAAIVCKHCGRDVVGNTARAVASVAITKKRHILRNALIVVGVLVVLSAIGRMVGSAGPKTLTAEHRAAVTAANTAHAWIQPTGLELSGSGFVVADYELVAGTMIPPRSIGETRLLAIREALLPFGFKNYRVNVNGPPPGTGLVRRLGSARFIDGGSVEWLTP